MSTETISSPIVLGPNSIYGGSRQLKAAAGYSGPAIIIKDAWKVTGGYAAASGIKMRGFEVGVQFEGKADRARLIDLDIEGCATAILASDGSVVRESWIVRPNISDCGAGIIFDGAGSVGDVHNQIDISAPHFSWVDTDLLKLSSSRSRPMRKFRVIGGQFHGPQDRAGDGALVSVLGNVRDIHLVTIDLNNSNAGHPGVLVAGLDGVQAKPVVVNLDVSTTSLAGDAIQLDAGKQIVVADAALNGVPSGSLKIRALPAASYRVV